MLNWLAKPSSESSELLDSLGSDKGLKQFWADLHVSDTVRTLDAIGEPLEKAASLNIRPDRLRHVLKHLDERAQEYIEATWARIFDSKDARAMSDSAWLVLARYYRNVHTGYRTCLDAMPAGGLSSGEREDAILLACRAMAAMGRHKALLRLRHRDPGPDYWEQHNRLAAWNARFGESQKPLELYKGSGLQTSTSREYLTALALDVAPVANMLPNQIAALDLILRQFSEHYRFSERFRAETPFVVDTTGAQAARGPRTASRAAVFRHWGGVCGTGQVAQRGQNVRAGSRMARVVPCGHGQLSGTTRIIGHALVGDPPLRGACAANPTRGN
ncbi:MAG: hypothetical protein EXR36_01795 [Betaproteobacteria bacterium]|nr:hypothetical protein [Betaproteobacteria bacterium]